GEPDETSADAQNRQIWSYPWVKVYIDANNRVAAWTQEREIKENIFEVISEAAAKALELDSKTEPKVKPLLDSAINYYSQLGEVSTYIPDYKIAIDAFVKAATLQESKLYSQVDPKYYFFAGQMAAVLGAETKQYFIDGENYLNKARELGYVDETGNLYYYLFHCYYGQREDNKENLVKAKNILLEGIEKFPKNERILDGLMSLYTAEDGIGDPAELVNMIDKFLAETPDNPDLWFGRGRVFYKLKNYDECIKSFLKINELKPNDYDTNFYIGYFYVEKAEHENRIFNTKLDTFTSTEEYNAARKQVRAVYMQSIPYLEKAHELKPDNVDCAQILKEVCFLLRDEEGVMDKYNKYNAVYKKLKGLE
ncbi:MAG: tetratricopeptide repeat protein, partial [Alistipes sp.]|nr:tetratricopeptide repeat protein [Alistipes sp.]